jgi:ferredoxin-NADP reductase
MSIVKKYRAEIAEIKELTNDVFTLYLRSETGKFKFFPGQFLHLTLDEYDPAEAWPESRCFSMQSSPFDTLLKITYAAKGRFTQNMKRRLKAGEKIWLKLPFGDLFTQDHKKENTVFIAGGTGITPYLSLFNSKIFAEYTTPHLYAGFRSRDHNLYDKEFKLAMEINPSLSITDFYEDKNGLIDIRNILATHKNGNSSFFISGPPQMIKNFKSFLLGHDVDEARIKTDDWE